MAASGRTTIQRWLLGSLLALALGLLVLTGSGVVLTREYKPRAPGLAESSSDAFRGIDRAERIHTVAAIGSGVAALAVTGLSVAAVVERRRRAAGPAPRWAVPGAAAVPAILLGAAFTGLLLPWDNLAIYSVSVGASYEGVLVAFRDDVRYVIIGGAEIGVETYRRWVIAHLGLLPALLVGVMALLGRLVTPAHPDRHGTATESR